ncbi:TIGR02302 family protein [Shimia biformata]|uniref:TIGR02302 family protein n=1 Tax=Shimia biformata TaxID=1294299 RepID=UPI00194EA6E4|nr:TIGR02302 family protein [Shimia biformata]
MGSHPPSAEGVLDRLRLVITLTRLGMIAEQVTRAFWPLWSLVFAVVAVLMFGVQDTLPLEAFWFATLTFASLSLWFIVRGARRFHLPSRQDALNRLDATLPGRPIETLQDHPAIGAGDAASEAIWQVHQSRMAKAVAQARRVPPDLKIARLDPFGLRYIAVLLLAVALLFGSFARMTSVTDVAAGTTATPMTGPSWEGWIEPPAYTGKPAIYLNDLAEGAVSLPVNSRVVLRLYGEVGALTVAETVSGRVGDIPPATDPEQEFKLSQDGTIEIGGPGGRSWRITAIPDNAPQIALSGVPDVSGRGEMSLPFEASDDYGIIGGQAVIALDLGGLDRRHGLAIDPDPRAELSADLPLPISGDRSAFQETLIEDYSKHVWAHLPVIVTLSAEDAAGQTGQSVPESMPLPARRFFDPLAAALIEQRRDLLWSKANGPRVAQMIRAISHRPEEGLFQKETHYLRLRTILRRLEAANRIGLEDTRRDELAEALWSLAIELEEGDLGDALERLRRAQERLAEAMKNGASDAEIAQLMQELRDATQDYMRQLAQQNRENGQDGADQQMAENSMQMTQDDLQRMMDRIQELMEQGRMAEAQQALQELQQMMENMQVTQGQGQGSPSEGDQAMEGLAETLRNQQGLSDQAFRELQEQFNPGANAGQSQGNEGFSGGEGRGQAHDGTGQGTGEDGQDGQSGQTPGELADRQQALRDELQRQENALPGQGTPEGDAARDALGRAGRAMDQAEDALREDDLAEAIDRQAEAIEALREGMRNLGEAMTQQQRDGQQGTAQNDRAQNRDPLGRSQGGRGATGTEEDLLQGEDVYRQARRLLDEIRRRAGEGERPEAELDYLKRLLDRF